MSCVLVLVVLVGVVDFVAEVLRDVTEPVGVATPRVHVVNAPILALLVALDELLVGLDILETKVAS